MRRDRTRHGCGEVSLYGLRWESRESLVIGIQAVMLSSSRW